jgi:hypothetical protein
LIVATGAVALFLVPFAFSAVPALASGIGSFVLPGHGLPFTGWILALLLGGILVGAALLRRRTALPLLAGAIGASAAAVIGIGVLLFIGRQASNPWSLYYPAKLTWLVTAFLVPVALAVMIRLVIEFSRPRVAIAGVAGLVLASLVLASAGPPPVRETFVITPPLAKIVFGSVWNTGESAVAKILEYRRTDHEYSRTDQRDLLWDTGDPDEAIINFWLLGFSGGDAGKPGTLREFTLRGYRELRDAGTFDPGDSATLCAVARELEPPVVVHTADTHLSTELAASCPNLKVTVLVDG